MQFGVLAPNVRITTKLLRLSKTTNKGKTEENWSSQRAYVTPFTVVKLTAMKNIISCSSILGHTSKHHLLECKRSSPEHCLPQLGAIQITGSVTRKAQRYADKWYTEVIGYWQQHWQFTSQIFASDVYLCLIKCVGVICKDVILQTRKECLEHSLWSHRQMAFSAARIYCLCSCFPKAYMCLSLASYKLNINLNTNHPVVKTLCVMLEFLDTAVS